MLSNKEVPEGSSSNSKNTKYKLKSLKNLLMFTAAEALLHTINNRIIAWVSV